MKNVFLYILIFLFSGSLHAQILDEYPKNQDFYEGGIIVFYKEINEYLVTNPLTECDAKEIYQPRITVTKEGHIKIIQDNDSENISKNKCAYDVSMKILKNLKHWKSAEVKGEKIDAITEFLVYPKDIMSAYKNDYNPFRYFKEAQYPKGNKEFQKKFHDNFMSLFSDYHINGDINLEFYINEFGEIINPRIYPEINNRAFNIEFMRTLARLKKTWKPALYSNIPIKQRISFPIRFSTNFEER